MAEQRQDPTVQELFDRTLRLEAEVARLKLNDVAIIKKEIQELRRDLQGLWEAFKSEVENTTMHFGTIDEHLWPVVYKLFPRVAEAHSQLHHLTNKPPSKDGNGKS